MPDLPAYANLDPALCLTTGLFSSLRRGTRGQSLKLTWPKVGEAGGNRSREVLCFNSEELLGVDDLRVLQGVLAFASRQPTKITSERRGELGRLRSRLRLGGSAEDGDACLVQLSFSELARAVGYGGHGGGDRRDSGDIYGGGIAAKVRRSLDRLARLTVSWADGDASAEWQLLSWDDGGPRSRKLRVALDPRTGSRALGNPSYARIDLAVARKLTSDPARLLHLRLSAWMGREKKQRRIRIDTLAGYPWSLEASGPDCLRKRRWRMDRIVAELRQAGWSIEAVPGDAEVLLVSIPQSGAPEVQEDGPHNTRKGAEISDPARSSTHEGRHR